MRRSPLSLLAIVLALGLVAASCGSDPVEAGLDTAPAASAADTADDSDAPGAWPHDFVGDLIGGGTFDAGDFEGQDLVLWFWAPW